MYFSDDANDAICNACAIASIKAHSLSKALTLALYRPHDAADRRLQCVEAREAAAAILAAVDKAMAALDEVDRASLSAEAALRISSLRRETV